MQDLDTILSSRTTRTTWSRRSRHRLANDIVLVNDGGSALDYPYRRGLFARREPAPRAVALLDLEMPKVDGFAVPHRQGRPGLEAHPLVMLTSAKRSDNESS